MRDMRGHESRQPGLPSDIRRRTAYALAITPLDVIHRSTIRAMLPKGARVSKHRNPITRARLVGEGKRTTLTRNVVSEVFGETLRKFEELGAIRRGVEFVQILERDRLLAYAMQGDAGSVHQQFVALDEAVRAIRVDLAVEKRKPTHPAVWVDQRRAELAAIERLMAGPVGGSNWSGKGSVRFVPHGAA